MTAYVESQIMLNADDLIGPYFTVQCLVYSFGVGGDISFERHLSSLGCTIHAFDPTVNEPKNLPANFHFKKLGVMGKEYINNNEYAYIRVPI